MSQVSKVKKDSIGLYVNAEGWITRPFFGTVFQEGDKVKAHHFGGSPLAGVGFTDSAHFKKPKTHEYWSTTGVMASIDYPKMTKEEIEHHTQWYKNFWGGFEKMYKKHNEEFVQQWNDS